MALGGFVLLLGDECPSPPSTFKLLGKPEKMLGEGRANVMD